jgi:hypothetical protein
MSRKKKLPKTGDNPNIILCKKSKRFENIIVCTHNCFDRCDEYKKRFNIEIIKEYLENHPDYEMKGIIMATGKKTTDKSNSSNKNTKSEKIYWIINEENKFMEVTESEIINNPADYLNKPMYEKPKDLYEIIVTIKKTK